jgi:hypothetical protein
VFQTARGHRKLDGRSALWLGPGVQGKSESVTTYEQNLRMRCLLLPERAVAGVSF